MSWARSNKMQGGRHFSRRGLGTRGFELKRAGLRGFREIDQGLQAPLGFFAQGFQDPLGFFVSVQKQIPKLRK